MTTEEVLQGCTIDGTVVKLPDVQLERKAYMDVKKHLEGIGGKWKGGKTAGFVFPHDPSELLGRVANGEKVNLKKDFQFFATPENLCDYLVNLAKLDEDHSVLEPSAGQGAIVEAIRKQMPNMMVECYELMPQNQSILMGVGGVIFMGENFLTDCDDKFDRIVANPPFTKGQDIEHLRKMYDLLEDEGLVVCITSTGWMRSTYKLPTAFREWLNDDEEEGSSENFDWGRFERIGTDAQFYRKNGDRVYIEMVDAGTFKESGTGVRTVIVVIEKPNPFV